MSKITLELPVEEINLILEALGNLPFVRVHEQISKIHQQAAPQVTKAAAKSDSEDVAETGGA